MKRKKIACLIMGLIVSFEFIGGKVIAAPKDNSIAYYEEINIYNDNFDFDINKVKCDNAKEPLKIPTYVPDDDSVVHPSVVKFESKWNGYTYWMAMTPYPEIDNQYENPSIVVSNDGINWIEPEGISNPIQNTPKNGYNSDTALFFDDNKNTMYCIWREVADEITIKIASSIDGVNWSEAEEILNTPEVDNASPCIIYEDGKYKLFSIDFYDSPNKSIQMYDK